MINLREFTEAVDHKTKEMSKEELQTVLHSLARKVRETDREGFLEILNQVGEHVSSQRKRGNTAYMAKTQDKAEVEREYARLKKQFNAIEEEELMFDAQGYEDYSSGYWDSDWIYEYEDPHGIGETYEDGAKLIERCVNDGFYKIALEIFDLMIGTEVFADDGGDPFEMGFEEMIHEKLVSVNLDLLRHCVLYAAYQDTMPQKRAEVLYEYVLNPIFHGVKLEGILSMGREELPELSQFWEDWIELLTFKEGDVAGELLCEAVLYGKNREEMMAAAKKAGNTHPSLTLAVLKYLEDRHDTEKELAMGQEALKAINETYVIRSEIALKTARAALETGNVDLAEQCWQKAFESAPCSLNYLRIAVESRDKKGYCQKAVQVIKAAALRKEEGNPYSRSEERKVGILSESESMMLRFLTGDFDGAMEECLSVKAGLGWSGEFVKCGVPLFLLLLLKTDTLKAGTHDMAKTAAIYMNFRIEEYRKGTSGSGKTEGKKGTEEKGKEELLVFWQCFCSWKESHGANEITEETADRYLASLEKLIDMRVKAIISGQHRSHYGSVAALGAALGEVKESRGEAGAKRRLLLGYKEEFPRHSSFHQELRAYGMPDTRKGAAKQRW